MILHSINRPNIIETEDWYNYMTIEGGILFLRYIAVESAGLLTWLSATLVNFLNLSSRSNKIPYRAYPVS